MGTKQKIIEALEGKRTERVWELIEKSVKEVYKEDIKIPKETKKEYFSYEGIINDKIYRYLIIEQYNIEDDFYFRYYEEDWGVEQMYENYFADCDGSWEQILLVDMKEMKCYLLDKELKYHKKEVKIK